MSEAGQFVVAVVMALGQMISPYPKEKIAEFSKKSDLTQAQKDAYEFQPKSIEELTLLAKDEEALARYLRAACLRVVSSTQTQKSIQKGELLQLSFDFLLNTMVQDKYLISRQERLMPNENIDLLEVKELITVVCDSNKKLASLVEIAPSQALAYYKKQVDDLPVIKDKEDLPTLQEVSYIYDASGAFMGEMVQHEVSDSGQIITRNRRRITDEVIPTRLKQALVSVEDSRFWNFKDESDKQFKGHQGVDFKGLLRAAESSGSGGSVQGGSTITMQLAKNLILYQDVYNEHRLGKRSLVRKLKEYILVDQLERALSKDEILDKYFHTIDFGRNSQGIVLAAENYFGKSLGELNLEEMAFLAGLPKAPNGLEPTENYERSLKRRNHVLARMFDEGYINDKERKEASKKSIKTIPTSRIRVDSYLAHYMSAVQFEIEKLRAESSAGIPQGLKVQVPINHQYQRWAVDSLQRGLLDFERTHGLFKVRSSEDRLPNILKEIEGIDTANLEGVIQKTLMSLERPQGDMEQFQLAVFLGDRKYGLETGELISLSGKDRNIKKEIQGKLSSIEIGDVVYLQKMHEGEYRLASSTEIQGGLVVIDNNTGNIIATAGGFSMGAYNRYMGSLGNLAFSAFRQPGSTVKPFTYLMAMNKGIPTTEVLSNSSLTIPSRYVDGIKVCGPWHVGGSSGEGSQMTLREGLEKSRNRITAQTFSLASGVLDYYDKNLYNESLSAGLNELHQLMQSYGLYKNLDELCYPLILGTYETSVRDITGAFAGLAAGHPIKTSIIQSLSKSGEQVVIESESSAIDDLVRQVVLSNDSNESSSINHYRLVSMLQGTLKRGTGKSLQHWSDIMAGKTGTTNESRDTWFVGFNSEITVGVWVGYPDNRPIPGKDSEGSTLALPVFEGFMETYYRKFPEKLNIKINSEIPQGMLVVNVEPTTGFLVTQQFIDDFQYYTGQGNFHTVQEVVDYQEYDRIPLYSSGSRQAGIFFFNNLTESRKNQYFADYESQYNYRQWDATYRFCIAGINSGRRRNRQVRAACRYVENNPRPVEMKLVNYFLTQNGFY